VKIERNNTRISEFWWLKALLEICSIPEIHIGNAHQHTVSCKNM
jgi:hypothetical protein